MPRALALAAAVFLPGSQDVRLAFRPDPGTSGKYVLTTRAMIDATGLERFGQDVVAEQEVELVASTSEPDGTTVLELRYGRAHGTLVSPLFERVTFDSRQEEAELPMLAIPLVTQFERLDGRVVRVRIDAHGRVQDANGYVDAYRGSPLEFLFAMGGYPLSEALFLDDAQALFPLLPEGPVDVDTHWRTVQDADFIGVLLGFELDCVVGRIDTDEIAWSFASVGAPIANLRRELALAEPAPGLDALSVEGGRASWIRDEVQIDEGAMSGTWRASRANGWPVEARLRLRSRGSMPHTTGQGRVTFRWSHEQDLDRADAATGSAAVDATESEESSATGWIAEIDDLLARSVDVELGRTTSAAFEPRGSNPGAESRLQRLAFRVRAPAAGAHEAELSTPAFRGRLVACAGSGTITQATVDATGSTRVRFETRSPHEVVLLLVEAPPAAHGPLLLSVDRVQEESMLSTPSSKTMFDGAHLVDATTLLERTPADRSELVAYYRLFAAGAERWGDEPMQHAHLHVLHAQAARANGELDEARAALDAARRTYETAPAADQDTNVRIEILGMESSLAREAGRLGAARAALDELEAFVHLPEIHPELGALTLHTQAVSWVSDFGDPERAIETAREAFARIAAHGIDLPRLEAGLHQVTGLALQNTDARAAEAAFQSGLSTLIVAGDSETGIAAYLRGLVARCLAARGDQAAARRELDAALDILVCAGGFDSLAVSQVLAQRANVLEDEGRMAEAFQTRQDALWVVESWAGESSPDARAARLALARVQAALGRVDDAWREIARVVASDRELLGTRIAALSESERLRYQATQRAALDLANELTLLDEASARVAYDATLLVKGAVARGLDAERARLRASGDSHSARIVAELATVQSALSSSATSADAARSLRDERDALERELARIASDAGEARPAAQAATLHEVLRAGEVLVEFVLHRSALAADGRGLRLSAWIVRADDSALERVDLGPAAPIESAVEAWRAAIDPLSARGLAPGLAADADVFALGQRVAGLVWLPLAGHVDGALRVVLCPDGFLAGVPFGALPADGGGYLIEEIDFRYVNDSSRLAREEEARLVSGSALFVGGLDHGAGPDGARWPALPGTLLEVETLARLHREAFGGRLPVEILRGTEASESKLRAALERAGTIHVATHGFVEPAAPTHAGGNGEMHAGLVVSREPPGGADDARLMAEEIAGLDLSRARIVVLSACSSGVGRAVPGEGMLGLRRAFRRAGAGVVVSALWPVPDAWTVELMTAFYGRMWTSGLAPEEALRAAQLAVLHETRARGVDDSPLAWGAFVIE